MEPGMTWNISKPCGKDHFFRLDLVDFHQFPIFCFKRSRCPGVLVQDYFYDWRPATSEVVREMEAEMLEARIQDGVSPSDACRVPFSVTSLYTGILVYHVSVQDTMAYLDCCP